MKDTTSITGTCVVVSMPTVGCVSQAGLAYLGRNHNLSAESSEFGLQLGDVTESKPRAVAMKTLEERAQSPQCALS